MGEEGRLALPCHPGATMQRCFSPANPDHLHLLQAVKARCGSLLSQIALTNLPTSQLRLATPLQAHGRLRCHGRKLP